MSCDEVREVLPDLGRGTLPPASRAEALRHLEGCGACGHALADERRLSQDLRDLAQADQGFEAPLVLEARLRRALRARRRGDQAPGRGVPAWAWPVAAAVAGLALWSAVPRASSPVRAADSGAVYRRLPGGDIEDMDGYQVVRVELSRPALLRLGFPAGDLEARKVAADVIVGQDGVARGIRLVR